MWSVCTTYLTRVNELCNDLLKEIIANVSTYGVFVCLCVIQEYGETDERSANSSEGIFLAIHLQTAINLSQTLDLSTTWG